MAAAQADHSAHLVECAAARVAAALRISELEAQLAKNNAELADLMKKFVDLTAAKVTTDALNSDLQAQTQRDLRAAAERDGRIQQLEADLAAATARAAASERQASAAAAAAAAASEARDRDEVDRSRRAAADEARARLAQADEAEVGPGVGQRPQSPAPPPSLRAHSLSSSM
jgi:hypothetical protein